MEYEIENGVLLTAYLKDNETAIIPDSVKEIRTSAFYKYINTLKSVYIPSSVKRIKRRTFFRCKKLENVYFPEGLEEIDDYAFAHCCNLKDIQLPKSVKFIGQNAFVGTPFFKNLKDEFVIVGDGVLLKHNGDSTDLVIPDFVKSICADSLNDCDSIISITLPNSIKKLNQYQFAMCLKLKMITLPEGLLTIDSKAFLNCASLKEITLPASIEKIAGDAFSACSSLERITVREGCQNYSDIDGVLYNKTDSALVHVPIMYRQTHYTIPECVRFINEGAFANNEKITQVVIPESTERIRVDAFFMCSSLESVTILSKDLFFGYCPFISCDNLTEIYMPNGCDNLDNDVFDECNNIRLFSYKGYEFRADPLQLDYYTAENLDELIIDKNYDTGAYTDIVMIHTVAATDFVQHHLEKAEKYVREHAVGILHTLIDGESVLLFKGIISMQNILTREQAEIIAEYAIKHTQQSGSAEFQVLISEYATSNFGSGDYFETLEL